MSGLLLIREIQFLLVFLVGICFTKTPSFSFEINTHKCIEKEGEAIRSIHPTCAKHYSQYYRDCCNWPGVYCSNLTGHVNQLLLSEFLTYCEDGLWPLQSYTIHLDPSLIALEDLIYLEITNLAGTYEVHANLSFIGSFPKLRYLIFTSINLNRDIDIPHQVGNLTKLQYLEISEYSNMFARSLNMLSHLTSLRRLILPNVNLSEATDWLHVVSSLPSLEHLELSECSLPDAILHPHSIINSSKSLAFLDLSYNFLKPSSIWTWIFNHSSLVRISLSETLSSGSKIPSRFRKMTSLSHLDLSGNILMGDLSSIFQSLSCSNKSLTSLSHLDLSGNILKGDLSSIFQSLSCSNKSLMFLSLQSNNLTGSLPDFTKFHSLTELNLASNRLNGSFPSTFERRSNLVTLYLQENQLTGSVPDLSIFRSLRVLQLQNNQLNGTIHAGLGQLSRLEQLDISSNSLKGEISVSHLLNLSRLHHLDMSFNSLSFNVGSSWVPPFRLDTIGLASCRLGSRFPKWLQTQTNYVSLDMSHAGISDTIPFWFWNLSSRATFINLSHNRLRGELINPSTKNITASSISAIDLSSNLLEGSLTPFFGGYDYLNLSRNSFSGSISFICKSAWMLGLDLSHNLFSGKLPNCWSEFGFDLSVLDLSNNNLSGELPSSFGSLIRLNSLHLRNNKFSGKIPSFFCNFTRLFYLDLGDNLFSGEIPKWMGHMLPNLTVLSLRNNSFSGKVPLELCRLSSIQILDLSTNNISGVIPNCLCSFAAMTQKLRPPVDIQDMNGTFSSIGPYRDYISLVLKGFIYEYKNHLELVKSVDLSSNMLGGIIPAEISCLTGLISLNLSGNNLIGPITVKIGQLKSLESLDLSNNHLSSQIPSTLSNLNFLGTLSLANNNLSGRIPTGTQIQSFDASAFAGNPRLCGDPLPKKCIEEGAKADKNNNHKPKNNDEDIFLGLYISIALGFISGFWMVCGVLIFKRSWRYAYFRVWIHLYDRLYVITSLKLASVRRCIQA